LFVVGFDFDGVIIYNPLHIARGVIALFKKKFLHLNKTSFYKPKNPLQFAIWKLLFAIEIPALGGLKEIEKLKNEGKIKPILLTGRFNLPKSQVKTILKNAGFPNLFNEIITNDKNEQPHIFKERLIKEKKMNVYVEDNIDIVLYLNKCLNQNNPERAKRVEGSPDKCKILWIYNIIDRRFDYQPKFPTLKKAVESLTKEKLPR
jgi:hypothetical protein